MAIITIAIVTMAIITIAIITIASSPGAPSALVLHSRAPPWGLSACRL